MTMSSDIAALIERVEKASEGDFDLDKSILSMMGYSWRGMNYWHRDNRTMWPNTASVRFTTSIDAAVALIKHALDCDEWNVGTVGGDGSACIWIGSEDDGTPHSAATPALALILALLRALQSQEPR